MKRNAPAREGEGVGCLLAVDTDAYNIDFARLQFLLRRGVRPEWAAVLVPMAFGEAAQ